MTPCNPPMLKESSSDLCPFGDACIVTELGEAAGPALFVRATWERFLLGQFYVAESGVRGSLLRKMLTQTSDEFPGRLRTCFKSLKEGSSGRWCGRGKEKPLLGYPES